MTRKPGSMYRRVTGPAFTRSRYMGGVPNRRIMQFLVGNRVAAERGDFPIEVTLAVEESCQIRHTALEAGRVTANSAIRKAAGPQGYAMRVHVYPHHVLRENKQATGAGADRVSQGMRSAFGKNVGSAARVKAGQRIMTIHCRPANYLTAKDALRKAGMKFPSPIRVSTVKGEDQLRGII